MRWRYIIFTVGVLTLFFGGTMIVPLDCRCCGNGSAACLPLIKAMALTLVFGAVLVACFKT
jgi:hypothetical protein